MKFKIQKSKLATALRVLFFMYLIDLAYGTISLVLYFNWDKIKSIDKLILSLFYASVNPLNSLMAVIFFVVSLAVFYFLLKKYYFLRLYKNIGTIGS